MRTLATKILFSAFAVATGAGSASAQGICGVPADEAVLITWEANRVYGDRWQIFTPAGANAGSYRTEDLALARGIDDLAPARRSRAEFVCEVKIFISSQEFTGNLHRLNRPLHEYEHDVRQFIVSSKGVALERPAQNMCAPCDELRERLRIVNGKYRTLGDGLSLLQRARGELETNTDIANGIGRDIHGSSEREHFVRARHYALFHSRTVVEGTDGWSGWTRLLRARR